MLSDNGDVIKIDREYPKWRTDATMCLQFRTNFTGQYVEMRMRRVHMSMRTEDITAFSKRIRHCSVNRENDTKTISVDANCFEKRSKTAPFLFENG